MEKKWNVINTLFQKKDIHKFTWVSGVDGLKSLLDFVVVQEEGGNKRLDVNLFRCAGGAVSNHQIVIAKIRSLRRCPGRVVRTEEKYEIKVSELSKVTCKTDYKERLNQWGRE